MCMLNSEKKVCHLKVHTVAIALCNGIGSIRAICDGFSVPMHRTSFLQCIYGIPVYIYRLRQ